MDQRADASWPAARFVLIALGGAALVIGVIARFKGLGTWPLAVDEYYIARSVQNVLAFGLPQYDCGGYYTRGVAFQYVVAGLQMAGSSPELSGRVVAAVSSLIALPAVLLLGRRLHGWVVGLLAVAFIALSVWEIELARFGRMYAPFQAVFLWYLVFFLRYTVDGVARALWGMVLLTLVGALTWEGGVFLAALNLVPPFLRARSGRLSREDWKYLVGMGALLAPIAWFVMADLRTGIDGAQPALPGDFDPEGGAPYDVDSIDTIAFWRTLTNHPVWWLAALVPAGAALAALRWVWSLRTRPLAALGLTVALAAALLHQFSAFGTFMVLLLLTRLVDWQELRNREALPYIVAVLSSLLFWVAFGLGTVEWRAGIAPEGASTQTILLLAYELLRFPDFVQEIARPWGGALPMLSLGLAIALAVSLLSTIARRDATVTTERVLLVVLVLMLAAAASSGPPRHETRYVFFLYPVAILIAVTVVMRAFERLPLRRPLGVALGAGAATALFVASEDFNASHLANIDSAPVNFRLDLKGRQISHLLSRSDVRGAADWLSHHAERDDVVVNGFPSVDFYYPDFDYTYIDSRSQRFPAYACDRGTRERWGNLPLLYTDAALEQRLVQGQPTYLVASNRMAPQLLERYASHEPRIVWTSIERGIDIIRFEPGGDRPLMAVEAPAR